MTSHTKYIFWDWNGTLLDDVSVCINSMNDLLAERNLTLITEERYKNIFGFPVIDYYQKLGFSVEDGAFEKLSLDFINGYYNYLPQASLHNGALDILEYFAQKGYRQVVLSAMKKDSLEKMLLDYNLRHFFDHVMGLDNIYAGGKAHLANEFISENNIYFSDIYIIGDTLHDYEVAAEIGANCILISGGHQSEGVLSRAGVPVLKQLKNLNDFKPFSEN